MSKHDPFCGDDGCRGECIREAEGRVLEAAIVEAAIAWWAVPEVDKQNHFAAEMELRKALGRLRAFRDRSRGPGAE